MIKINHTHNLPPCGIYNMSIAPFQIYIPADPPPPPPPPTPHPKSSPHHHLTNAASTTTTDVNVDKVSRAYVYVGICTVGGQAVIDREVTVGLRRGRFVSLKVIAVGQV